MIVRVIFAVLVLALWSSAAWAVIPPLDQSGWAWSEESTLRVSGVRISERRWRASMPQAQAARRLSEHFTFLDRMLILNGRIVLSGLAAERHWLAEIIHHPAGSHGVVSVLDAVRVVPPGFDFSLYLPHGTHSVFRNIETLDNKTITRAAYRSNLPEAALRRHFRHVLSSAGWRHEASSGGTLHWWRGKAQLDLQIRPDPTGAQLWLQHVQEPETS
ncbi:MAG: hypothetical protein L0H54_00225 [Alcaligenaceae bacterium]|nr:hypothetical protein [Alcaligenaceae bacterium]